MIKEHNSQKVAKRADRPRISRSPLDSALCYSRDIKTAASINISWVSIRPLGIVPLNFPRTAYQRPVTSISILGTLSEVLV